MQIETNSFTLGRDYLSNILLEVPGLKCLFLDDLTLKMVSTLYFKSDLFKFSVFDSLKLEDIGNYQGKADKAVCIVSPSSRNFDQLITSLKTCRFENIYLCKYLSPKGYFIYKLIIFKISQIISRIHRWKL